MKEKYILKLYITGNTGNSQTAINNLNKIIEPKLKGLYTLEIIDVLKDVEMAIEDNILATPTLIKVSPKPVRKIIGDLSDKDKVLSGLGLEFEPEKLIPVNLQNIHKEACLQTSDALARLLGKRAIVDIANQNIEKVSELSVPFDPAEEIASVSLPVSGQVKGSALLLFSRETACHLSDLLIKKELGFTKQLDELDKSALQELGNIICGNYLATLANHSGIKMIEHIAPLTFNMLPVLLEQIITTLSPDSKDVMAIGTEFNFAVPILIKGHCFKTYFLVLFETTQYEKIVDFLQKVAV